ncbi:hypothetical protein ABZ470_31805 [Streptosporangium sp. NPDC020072]|uniref:hypothetical protein n=1 Tax=Streptosporangium sp. NPDC020072 TaxID=3154788 RepID=UPI00344A02F1
MEVTEEEVREAKFAEVQARMRAIRDRIDDNQDVVLFTRLRPVFRQCLTWSWRLQIHNPETGRDVTIEGWWRYERAPVVHLVDSYGVEVFVRQGQDIIGAAVQELTR